MSHPTAPLASQLASHLSGQSHIAPLPERTGHHVAARPASHAEIASRAYDKWEARGRVDGFDLDDWIDASHELTGDVFRNVSSPSLSPSPRSS